MSEPFDNFNEETLIREGYNWELPDDERQAALKRAVEKYGKSHIQKILVFLGDRYFKQLVTIKGLQKHDFEKEMNKIKTAFPNFKLSTNSKRIIEKEKNKAMNPVKEINEITKWANIQRDIRFVKGSF